MKKVFHSLSRVTESLEKFVICFSIILMMVNSVTNAIGRYAFNQSLFFSEELNQFLIIAITFIGFSYAVRRGRNIRMTAMYDALSYNAKKVITTFITISTATLLAFLAYKAVFYILELKDLNRLSPALQLPVYLIYSIIPFGLAMAAIQYLIAFIMNLTHKGIYLSYDVIDDQKL
ncbi:MAG: TRAP transporter small permease [Oceanospirillaceae bacterium]